MKMEGADLLKLSASTKNTDTGGLTFGPAWLRQLSSGDSTKVALPPSPGLAFQLAKHRYGREEMLAIYESIEHKPFFGKAPVALEKEFEDLFRRDLQRPVLLYAPSHEEQKCLSTCVNSQVVLNSYNKTQGQPDGGGNSSGGGRENRSSNSNGGVNNGGGGNASNGRHLRNTSESENGAGGGGGPSSNRERNISSLSRGGSNSMRGSRGGASGISGSNGERERGGGSGGGGGGRGGDRAGGGMTMNERGNISERGGGRGRG